MDELDQSLGDGGLRGKKFALDAADVCAHTACGDDEAVADGDPRQLSVVERRDLPEQSNHVLHHHFTTIVFVPLGHISQITLLLLLETCTARIIALA